MAAFVHELRVRYHETDAQQHVYNARYLEYVDVAMIEYCRHLGSPYGEMVASGFDPVLARVELDFRRPASFDELLRVAVAPERVGEASFVLGFAIRNETGEDVATAKISYVNFDATARRSRPIPEAVRERLLADAEASG